MRIAIIAKSGPAAGRRIVLRGGQTARVGRTDLSDFALPEDLDLAEIHFVVTCNENAAMLQALASDRETRINGAPVSQLEIQHGDAIEAGATLFWVELEGATKLEVEHSNSRPVSAVEAGRNEAFEIAEYIGLSQESIELARASTDPKRLGNELVLNSKLQDALQWYAHTISKQQAVQWACDCVEDLMRCESDAVQLTAYRAAMRWGREPNDDNREDAKQLAEVAKHEGVGGILAASAGWSGGSLAPSDQPEVPPDDRLTARCVCIALAMASNEGAPGGTNDRLLGYIDRLREPHSNQPLP